MSLLFPRGKWPYFSGLSFLLCKVGLKRRATSTLSTLCFCEFESVLNEVDELEPMIQSQVSQKEKSKYCVLTHVCGI